VLLDASFLRAVVDPDDPARGDCRAEFETFLDEFPSGSTTLYTHSDAIAEAAVSTWPS